MIPTKSFFDKKLTGIYRASENIEELTPSFTYMFSDAQFIQKAVEELDTALTTFFNELYDFLASVKHGEINEKQLDLLIYMLER